MHAIGKTVLFLVLAFSLVLFVSSRHADAQCSGSSINNNNNVNNNSAESNANSSAVSNTAYSTNIDGPAFWPQELKFVDHMYGMPPENFLFRQSGRDPSGIWPREDVDEICDHTGVNWFKACGAGMEGGECFLEDGGEKTDKILFVKNDGRLDYVKFEADYIPVGTINRRAENKKLTQEHLRAYACRKGMKNGATVLVVLEGWVVSLDSETSGVTLGGSSGGSDAVGTIMAGWAQGSLERSEEPAIVGVYYRPRTEEEKQGYKEEQKAEQEFTKKFYVKETPEQRAGTLAELERRAKIAKLEAEAAEARLNALKATKELEGLKAGAK